MTLKQHSTISGAGAVAIVAAGYPWQSAAAFFVAGVFIDLDHLFEYWTQVGPPINLRHFFTWFKEKRSRYVYVWLHAWEWVLLITLFNLDGLAPQWVYWGVAGWTFHLILDQLSNGMHPLGYFILFRILKKFDGVKVGNHPENPAL